MGTLGLVFAQTGDCLFKRGSDRGELEGGVGNVVRGDGLLSGHVFHGRRPDNDWGSGVAGMCSRCGRSAGHSVLISELVEMA